jgi:hypothetical protein
MQTNLLIRSDGSRMYVGQDYCEEITLRFPPFRKSVKERNDDDESSQIAG